MQGFIIPELIVESIIRDGIMNIRADKTIIDSIFAQLTRAYNNRKYGAAEITKIKAMIDKEIAVVFSYHQLDANVPCFSVMVGTDTDDKKRAHLGDHYEEVQEDIVNPVELAALIRVPNVTITSYDPMSGKVSVPDGVNLSVVYTGMIYKDSTGNTFDVGRGISNTPGDKFFFIEKGSTPTLTGTGTISSSLDYKQYEVKGVTGDIQLVIGAHAKDALTCKYLYILLKYFLLSRKPDMIKRCLYATTYSGSDFNRDSQFIADQIYTRFLTLTGKIDDTWRSDQVVLIDNIEVDPDPIE